LSFGRRENYVDDTSPESVWLLSGVRPWGDYGSILVHGMSRHLRRVDGRIQLERTGPFIPPVTLPGIGDIVVTAAARAELEQSGMSGLTFRTVDKARIVEFNWNSWDQTAPKPAHYPDSGEPEDYILSRPHDDQCARDLGDLFELVPTSGGIVAREELEPRNVPPTKYRYTIQPDSIPSVDIFRAQNMRDVFVSERMGVLLESMPNNACHFQSVTIGPLPPPQLPLRRFLSPGEEVPPEYELTETTVSPFTGEPMRIATLRK
jgi:hypothetical protein